MTFEPKTEQEIAESKLWPKGEYGFEIVDASEKNNKTSGKPMIELKAEAIRRQRGRSHDYRLPSCRRHPKNCAIVRMPAGFSTGITLAHCRAAISGETRQAETRYRERQEENLPRQKRGA